MSQRLLLHAPHLSAKVSIPTTLYGTAWKKEKTTDLVHRAVCNGFRGVDTACQPKHYREDLVGAGLRRAYREGKARRDDMFVQTKFTGVDGHDQNDMPYDSKLHIPDQVKTSIATSLRNLRVTEDGDGSDDGTYLDSVVMHSPMQTIDDTMDAWRTLEEFVKDGKIGVLGISNVDMFTLMDIYHRASIQPSIIQNRFHKMTKFDIGLRRWAREQNLVYQGFWTLTANPTLLRCDTVNQVSSLLSASPAAAFYCLFVGLGRSCVLNGSTDDQHMTEDLKTLANAEVFATKHPDEWTNLMKAFRKELGEPIIS